MPVNGSSGGFQKLFSFSIHGRTKKKSILSTYLSSNCFSVTGRSPPLILQLMFTLVTTQEASTSLRGKSVKCDVIKIPFKINNDQLSPSRRYLEKILQSKRMNGQSWHSRSGSPRKRYASPMDHCYASCKYMSENPSSCPSCPDVPFLSN